MMYCKGICKNFIPTKIITKTKKEFGVMRYIHGQKYCKICSEWIYWDGGITKTWAWQVRGFIEKFVKKNRCPCCCTLLRCNSRNTRLKNRESRGIEIWNQE